LEPCQVSTKKPRLPNLGGEGLVFIVCHAGHQQREHVRVIASTFFSKQCFRNKLFDHKNGPFSALLRQRTHTFEN
jgi:hypothetical protein